MTIRDFILPHTKSSHASYPVNPAHFGLNLQNGQRPVPIRHDKSRPIRHSKAATMPPSCTWYEAEDRNVPSVSSF